MNAYLKEYNRNLFKAKNAILCGKNIIICGPEMTGKSNILKEVKELLVHYDYEIFYGVQDYNDTNLLNGRHYTYKKFWIEEQNRDEIVNILDDYEYIETKNKFNHILNLNE